VVKGSAAAEGAGWAVHRFFSVPGLLLPGRHGMIQGHIFRDDDSGGLYNVQAPALSGVEVRLDENRVTRTDASGYYSFHHVPFGVHRVEAKLQSGEPFFYTTDSPATVDMNATVDFGVNFAKGQVFGFLLNDAGTGINGVTVELKGEKYTRRVQTGVTGKFAFTGLAPGNYSVATLPDSYPAGYALQDLAAQSQGIVVMTKIAARLTRTFTDRFGLKDLCKELLGVDLSKQQQTSDWGADGLSEEQLAYAASDVLYLHALKAKLDALLEREGRTELAAAAFDFLPTRARLDLAGWSDVDIFEH